LAKKIRIVAKRREVVDFERMAEGLLDLAALLEKKRAPQPLRHRATSKALKGGSTNQEGSAA